MPTCLSGRVPPAGSSTRSGCRPSSVFGVSVAVEGGRGQPRGCEAHRSGSTSTITSTPALTPKIGDVVLIDAVRLRYRCTR